MILLYYHIKDKILTGISLSFHLPIFEAALRDPSVEGGLPTLEPRPLGALSRLGTLMALAASLSCAGTDTPAHTLPVSSGTLVGA